MITEKEKKIFYRWLKERNLYSQFIRNVHFYGGIGSGFNYFKYINRSKATIRYIISEAFSWEDSEEGFDFWEDICDLWILFYLKNDKY